MADEPPSLGADAKTERPEALFVFGPANAAVRGARRSEAVGVEQPRGGHAGQHGLCTGLTQLLAISPQPSAGIAYDGVDVTVQRRGGRLKAARWMLVRPMEVPSQTECQKLGRQLRVKAHQADASTIVDQRGLERAVELGDHVADQGRAVHGGSRGASARAWGE